MHKIDKDKLEFKILINFSEGRGLLNLLYEIVKIINNEQRIDKVFNIADISTKTLTRVNDTIQEDLEALKEKGYIKYLKYTQYELVKTPWDL